MSQISQSLLLCFSVIVITWAAPNHLKTIDLNDNQQGSVGASFALNANIAGTKNNLNDVPILPPVVVGSSSAESSAGVSVSASAAGSSHKGTGPTFFDSIFNIPRSILKSVGDGINQKNLEKRVSVQAHGSAGAVADGGAISSSNSEAASFGSVSGTTIIKTKNPHYGLSDTPETQIIINPKPVNVRRIAKQERRAERIAKGRPNTPGVQIADTALKSVNDFLNGLIHV